MAEAEATPEQFHAAAEWLSCCPVAANLPNDVKLEIYGIYKLLTVGVEPDSPPPGWLALPATKAKYNAWCSQGKKYADHWPAARQRYLAIATNIGYDSSSTGGSDGKAAGGLGGVKVSVMKRDAVNKESEGRHPLHDAVLSGHVAQVESTLRLPGLLVDSTDDFGMTALHVAADRGNRAIVQTLLSAGADPTIKDPDGFTARDNAEGAEHADVVELL